MLGDSDHAYGTARRALNGQWYGWHAAQNRDEGENLYVRYLYWNDGHWNSSYNYLDNDWNSNNPAALLATPFISPRRPAFFAGPAGSFVW